MIYDTGEYDIQLDIPANNVLIRDLFNGHLEHFDSYLDSIRSSINRDTLIVLLGAFQCIQKESFWTNKLNQFVEETGNTVVVFSGQLQDIHANTDDNDKFHFYRICMFDYVSTLHWNRRQENQTRNWHLDSERDRVYKFYWASTKDWTFRRYILSGLIDHRLLENNLVNYKCLYSDSAEQLRMRYGSALDAIVEESNRIQHQLPLPPLDNTVEFSQTDVNFYLDSYLGIVTDTFFDNGIFVSEKVFNAMNYQQMFFYIGYQGTLKHLQDQGYCVFDDIIDIGYDRILDPIERLVQARKSLLNFLNQPLEQIKQAYSRAIPGIQHNKKLVMQQRPDTKITNYLSQLVK